MKKYYLVFVFFIVPVWIFAQTNPKDWNKKKTFPLFNGGNKSHSKVSPNERKKPFQNPKRKTKYMYPEWSFDGGVGTTNSFTDIGGKHWEGKDLFTDAQMRTTRLAYSLTAEYRHQTRMGYGFSFCYGKISGSDDYSPNTSRSDRHNSFTNNIFEFGLKHKIYLQNNIYRNGWNYQNPFQYYVYYGFNGFLNNPKLVDPTGWYEPKKKYSRIQVSIPIGAGFHYTYENHLRVGFDIAYRKTFTDYLDGFTTNWSDRTDAYMFSYVTVGYALSKNKYKKRTNDNKKPFKLKIF